MRTETDDMWIVFIVQNWLSEMTFICLFWKEEEEEDLNDREVDDEDDEGE